MGLSLDRVMGMDAQDLVLLSRMIERRDAARRRELAVIGWMIAMGNGAKNIEIEQVEAMMLPTRSPQRRRQTPAEMKMVLSAWAGAINAAHRGAGQ